MRVVVLLVQEFYQLAGTHRLVVELPEGARVRDVLERLPGPVRARVLGGDGGLRYPVMVAVNGRRVEFLGGLDAGVREGDVILVSPRPLFVV